MTANLTPQYKKAEQEFKAATDPKEKHALLELMLRLLPKHKGTEKMQSDLKTRIKKSREAMGKRPSGEKKAFSINVEREGAAQVVLVGAPNSGKSSLMEATTNARVEIGDHPFSTRTPVPGALPFENLKFQLVDLPPVSREHMEFWVTDIIRAADCALWVIDPSEPGFEEKMNEVTTILAERKVELVGPEVPWTGRQESIRQLPTLAIATKIDEEGMGEIVERLRKRLEPDIPVLATTAMGDTDVPALGRALFSLNRIVRVYSKTAGKQPDRTNPHILHTGDVLTDFAVRVHKDFAKNLDYARVWGKKTHQGQRVPRGYELGDEDVIELHE